MKKSAILFSTIVLGMTSCRPNVTDDANDAGGTASPYLAKQVVGVRMLSSDAPYEKASNLLADSNEWTKLLANVATAIGAETGVSAPAMG
ncbi:hypothetical protein EON80_24920 [bacterium]|nr:MAG: hypothetical protein EON80_24920 [bacterium]